MDSVPTSQLTHFVSILKIRNGLTLCAFVTHCEKMQSAWKLPPIP